MKMLSGKDSFVEEILTAIPKVVNAADSNIAKVAELFVQTLKNNGVIHAFGTGHSRGGALEIAGRAGGLIPTNKIDLLDLVWKGNHPLDVLGDPLNERKAEYGRELYELSKIDKSDLVVILSNSGINGAVVEFAILAKEFGVPVIAFGSTKHTAIHPSRHESGKKLSEICDVYIDNGAPAGDALLETKSGIKVCGISSITTAVIIQCIVAETVKRLEDEGLDIPVYVSSNISGGHERNLTFEAAYAGRIRRLGL